MISWIRFLSDTTCAVCLAGASLYQQKLITYESNPKDTPPRIWVPEKFKALNNLRNSRYILRAVEQYTWNLNIHDPELDEYEEELRQVPGIVEALGELKKKYDSYIHYSSQPDLFKEYLRDVLEFYKRFNL